MASVRIGVPQPRRNPKPRPAPPLDSQAAVQFGRFLLGWYRKHRRELPWRGIDDPYRIWVSEVMLQQTRVEAAIDHYRRFIARFPTVLALALAPEDEVLALWSGLGYYRRARLLCNAARFVVREWNGVLPRTAAELRHLPGIGPYTAAAIASIAFGQAVAVVDGNVERVLLRVAGLPEERSNANDIFVNTFAQSLVPEDDPGDHNQAMMELGATVCLPRGPLCLQCPVFDFCKTRGEHVTLPAAAMRSQRVNYGLCTRMRVGRGAEVLLHRRDGSLSLMPGMLELPVILGVPAGAEPRLSLRHAIVGTNYYVEVFALREDSAELQASAPEPTRVWVPVEQLPELPLTGLARKVLLRAAVMPAVVAGKPAREIAEADPKAASDDRDGEAVQKLPLLTGRHGRADLDPDAGVATHVQTKRPRSIPAESPKGVAAELPKRKVRGRPRNI